MSDTPKLDAQLESAASANDAVVRLTALCAELERENATLRAELNQIIAQNKQDREEGRCS